MPTKVLSQQPATNVHDMTGGASDVHFKAPENTRPDDLGSGGMPPALVTNFASPGPFIAGSDIACLQIIQQKGGHANAFRKAHQRRPSPLDDRRYLYLQPIIPTKRDRISLAEGDHPSETKRCL